MYNQENFLALQPDTSPIGNKSQKWVSFGTLPKQESLGGSRTGLGCHMGTERGGNGEEGQQSLTAEGHRGTNCSKTKPPEVQETLPCH